MPSCPSADVRLVASVSAASPAASSGGSVHAAAISAFAVRTASGPAARISAR